MSVQGDAESALRALRESVRLAETGGAFDSSQTTHSV